MTGRMEVTINGRRRPIASYRYPLDTPKQRAHIWHIASIESRPGIVWIIE